MKGFTPRTIRESIELGLFYLKYQLFMAILIVVGLIILNNLFEAIT